MCMFVFPDVRLTPWPIGPVCIAPRSDCRSAKLECETRSVLRHFPERRGLPRGVGARLLRRSHHFDSAAEADGIGLLAIHELTVASPRRRSESSRSRRHTKCDVLELFEQGTERCLRQRRPSRITRLLESHHAAPATPPFGPARRRRRQLEQLRSADGRGATSRAPANQRRSSHTALRERPLGRLVYGGLGEAHSSTKDRCFCN